MAGVIAHLVRRACILCVQEARQTLIEGLLEETKGLFEVKATLMGSPDIGEVWRARITPPSPEHVRVMRLPGQTTHTNFA